MSFRRNTAVTRGDWSVGCTYPRYDSQFNLLPGVILSICKLRDGGKFQYGEGNGRVFPNTEQAYNWAFEHGFLQPFVTSWCRHCRVKHTFLGKPSGFCPVRKEFCR